MAAIHTLLNPMPETPDKKQARPFTPRSIVSMRANNAPTHTRKKQKLCKDAAVFTRGPIRGVCRYPPHDSQDEMLAAQHQYFEIFPVGEIAEYPRHIPYNSEKKAFLDKTNRESLEVFQYNFKVPGDVTTYSMLWDYNIGLVRTTPLFKCTGYSKTTPAKMLNRNPGLREICHSITGGALVAQGYWMPYEAARAVAATFCWRIRYALTPVFGITFPEICIPPDSDKFGEMLIDSAVIKKCAEKAQTYRAIDGRSLSRASSATPSPLTPNTPTHPRRVKQLRPKNIDLFSNSPYSSDVSSDDQYTDSDSPEQSNCSLWTPANTPRSVPRPHAHNLQPPIKLHSNRQTTNHQVAGFPTSSQLSCPASSPKNLPAIVIDEGYDGDSDEDSDTERTKEDSGSKRKMGQTPDDEAAAYLLMSLRFQTPVLDQDLRGLKRRAPSASLSR